MIKIVKTLLELIIFLIESGFFPKSDACDGGGSGMKEFFPESDACNGGGSGCGEVSSAFSIKVRVSAYCRFD
jgi:hypothetical protein